MRFLILLLLSSSAWATDWRDPVNQTQDQAQDQAQQQKQQQQQMAQSLIESGAVEIVEGNNSVSTETNVLTDTPRQAPSVFAPAIQNTAPFMKCFGGGGSFAGGKKAGGATGWWCWIQRDSFAVSNYERLARMNQPEAAATAYCAQKLLWKPFGNQEDCYSTMRSSVDAMHMNTPEPKKIEVTVNMPCDEKIKRCEREVLK